MPAIKRGDHAAGTTQTSPISNATKNLVPKPILNRPAECARAMESFLAAHGLAA